MVILWIIRLDSANSPAGVSHRGERVEVDRTQKMVGNKWGTTRRQRWDWLLSLKRRKGWAFESRKSRGNQVEKKEKNVLNNIYIYIYIYILNKDLWW